MYVYVYVYVYVYYTSRLYCMKTKQTTNKKRKTLKRVPTYLPYHGDLGSALSVTQDERPELLLLLHLRVEY